MTSTSTEATVVDIVIKGNERQGRDMEKTASLKRRDASWDKKWQEHMEKNVSEDSLPRSSVFTRSPRLPGKVNRSMWESRVAQEAATKATRARPITPRHMQTSTGGPEQPKTTPHYGASLIDYSPSRTATPPYPSERVSSPDEVQKESALPPPPPHVVANENHANDIQTTPSHSQNVFVNEHEVTETNNDSTEIHDDWKKEVGAVLISLI